MTVVLALGWGALAFSAGHMLAARVGASERALGLRRPGPVLDGRASIRARGVARAQRLIARSGPVGRVLGGSVRRRAERRRDGRLARELPAAVDLLAVAVSAGATPFAAVATVAAWAPPAVAESFAAVVTACRLGAPFEGALHLAARRDPRLSPLTSLLATGSRLGAAMNDALARLAAESRRDLRRRAETRARTVPVRLLFPLVFLVLPAFGLLTVVPAVAAGFHGF
jgi:pilus assembly protein TadC